jgi:hypothetical protein
MVALRWVSRRMLILPSGNKKKTWRGHTIVPGNKTTNNPKNKRSSLWAAARNAPFSKNETLVYMFISSQSATICTRDLFVCCCFELFSLWILLKYYSLKQQSWPWSYGSWIYNYLCNQYLSPLTLWVRIPLRRVYPIQHYVHQPLYHRGCVKLIEWDCPIDWLLNSGYYFSTFFDISWILPVKLMKYDCPIPSPIQNRGWTQMLDPKCKQLLVHWWHPSCYC